MSKYNEFYEYQQQRPPVVPGENVILQIKPKKNAFVLNKILAMMPIAILWLAFDGTFIVAALSGNVDGMTWFLIPFFLLHLMPVWIWLGNVLTANRRWKNTVYYVTDRRIIIQTGFMNRDLHTIYYKDIRDVNLRVGILDKLLHVGDIHFDLGQYDRKGRSITSAFLDVEHPHEVYTRIQKIIMDIQTDIEFPNAYRPEENPGYNTKYGG